MRTHPTPAATVWNVQPLQQQQDDPTPPAPPAPTPPAGTGDAPPAPAGRTFTEAEMESIAKGRAARAEESVHKALAEKWGVSMDEADQLIAAAKAKAEGEKTEAQKAKDAADKAAAEAATTAAAAAKELHDTKVERALIRAGVPITADKPENQAALDKKLAKIVGLVDVDLGADDAAIAAAVTELHTAMPELFAGPAPAGNAPPKPPSTDPKVAPKTPKTPEDAFSRGAERARQNGGGSAAAAYPWETPANAGT